MLEHAVKLDPEFTLAYCELSRAHTIMYFFGFDRSLDRLTKAKNTIDRAFELNPGLPEAHLALGFYYYAGFKDYESALREYSIAEKDLPSNTSLLNLIGAAKRRTGDFEGGLQRFKRVFELSPREASAAWDIAVTLSYLRKYEEADPYFEKMISLAPDQRTGYIGRAWNYLLWKGETRQARAVLEKTPENNDPDTLRLRWMLEACDRNWKGALEVLGATPKEPLWQGRNAYVSGFIYLQLNEMEKAQAELERARKILEEVFAKQPENNLAHYFLGLTYAHLGRKEDAIREGKRAAELIPLSEDAVWGPGSIEGLALIYALVGESDSAIDLLEQLLTIPWDRMSVGLLRIDPRWDPLRNHPRFQKLLLKEN
jgi:serine/threonine-protein kinase